MIAGLFRRRRTGAPAGDAAIGAVAPRSAARTHVGQVRRINEDRMLDRADRGLWAVADGMGGHSAGDVAASIAVAALNRIADAGAPPTVEAVEAALHDANREILDRCAAAPGTSGTTIVAMLIAGGRATLFWAGDSRAYRVRGGAVEQLTRDHSLVQEMVDAGAIDTEAARHHPRANVVTRAMGVAAEVAFDRAESAVLPGDAFILCSDGFSRTLDPVELLPFAGRAVDAAADALLAQALARDGTDNISVVLVQV